MRRLFGSRGRALFGTAFIGGLGTSLLRTRAVRKEKDTGRQVEAEKPFGYDMYLKDIKKYPIMDQQKLSCPTRARNEHLKDLKNPNKTFDVLVIGGGCNGAGVALEAATRGLSCALIDRADFAAGTSSRSTKLIHGGIRYLEEVFKLERGFVEKLALVVEGLDERNYMLNSAAYMNKKVEMVVPCSNLFWLLYYYAGVNLYHFVSFAKWCFSDYSYRLPRPKLLSKTRMRETFPLLRDECYGVRFSEGQMQDARLVVQTLLTASIDNYIENMKGAVLGNYIEFLDLVKDSKGQILGARVRDLLDGKEFTIKAKVVVNCAGSYADNIRLKDNPQLAKRIVCSRGVHIILPKAYTQHNLGIIIPKTSDGRVMFILPYQNLTLAGTTDHRCPNDPAPFAPEGDVSEITSELCKIFKGDIKTDIKAAWCGIRPLVEATNSQPSILGLWWKKLKGVFKTQKSGGQDTKSLTRSHVVEVSDSGLISLLGGKWTAHRKMGQDTIDEALKRHPEIAPANKATMSRLVRLHGSYTSKTVEKDEKDIHEFVGSYTNFLHEKYALDWDIAQHLVECYGTQAVFVAKLGQELRLNERLHKNLPSLKVQVLYAIRKEFAVNVKDVVFRRLGLGFTDQKLAAELIPTVAELMASELGWNNPKLKDEIADAQASLLRLS